jgi:hypothetical protein
VSSVLRSELVEVAQRLVAKGGSVLSLDEIADALGTVAVDSDEIDALFSWLETQGRNVGDVSVGKASTALPQVLAAARALRGELGRTPKPAEIAARAGLGEDAVRRALLFVQILQR